MKRLPSKIYKFYKLYKLYKLYRQNKQCGRRTLPSQGVGQQTQIKEPVSPLTMSGHGAPAQTKTWTGIKEVIGPLVKCG